MKTKSEMEMLKNKFLKYCLAVAAVFTTCLKAQDANHSILKNSQFEEWRDGKPVGWNILIGATSGANKTVQSKVEKGEGATLKLSGDRSTGIWNLVAQAFTPTKGEAYLLRISSKAKDLRREARQFNNCHANYAFFDQSGKKQAQKFFPLGSKNFAEIVVPIKPLDNTAKVEVGVFLSKTGSLFVKEVAVEPVSLKNSYELLVADMDRNYSYFDHKKIDWEKLTEKYRERAVAATDTEGFKKVLLELFAEMNDGHVWINHKDQKFLRKTSVRGFDPNFDFASVDADLKDVFEVGDFGLVGTTSNGFGYVRITSLINIDQNQLQSMMSEIEGLFDKPGIILDLRRNRGGAEPVAAQIASLFPEKERIYARSRFRSGPSHHQFFEAGKRKIAPRKGRTYKKPIVCMIGPGAVSSAEGFAMMMSAIKRCKMIGQPTRGSSGNPAPVHLVDQIQVYYSRWISMMPDGTPIEDNGVPVDEKITHRPGSDVTYDRAKEILAEAR